MATDTAGNCAVLEWRARAQRAQPNPQPVPPALPRLDHIRNFSVIAHIDHGKSTLSDRFIQHCGGLDSREMTDQVLDSMDIERERGITIKAQAVSLDYRAQDGHTYQLNFIDTPGHVDFSYEVSRSLAACEGALLVVDAAQGVEAQSVANCCTAIAEGLEVIPVLNKIDLPQAEPQRVMREITEIIGVDGAAALQCSAKTGAGVPEVLEQIVQRVPPPRGDPDAPLQALIIDSWFDNYLGVVSLVRVVSGQLRVGQRIRSHSISRTHQVDQLGIFTPRRRDKPALNVGEVGYVIAGIKDVHGAPVGDTLVPADGDGEPLQGFQKVRPQVYAGIFPISGDQYGALRESLERLALNDASLFYEPETSDALGFGFRCGFLGMLHLEIVQQRLQREHDVSIISTAPTVVYQVLTKAGQVLEVDNPSRLPDMGGIEEIREPLADVNILVPQQYLGDVIALCVAGRGVQTRMEYSGNQVSLGYRIPMAEVVVDFFDRLKSVSRGFASLDYQVVCFAAAPLVRLDMLINGDRVDALALIVHRDDAMRRGRALVERMKDLIPRQMYDVAIQAALGGRIVARSTVKALRKNVLAKCYGGDVTRKKKLLEKQRAGKRRMKQLGRIEVPQDAFLAVLRSDN